MGSYRPISAGHERQKPARSGQPPVNKSVPFSPIEAARREGYTYENGTLFAPQAIEARNRVQDYLKARQALFNQGEWNILDEDAIAELLAEKARRYEQASDCSVNCRATFTSYLRWWKEQEGKIQRYSAYFNAIVSVADYGLAVPEYALIQDGQHEPNSGIKRFKTYLETERQQRAVHEKIHAKYRGWIEAAGQNTPAPAGLVEAERAEWDKLQAANETLRQEAERNVANSFPRRHLLWHPETFQPEPEQRLVKTDFPLREISLPNTGGNLLSRLSHLSLHDLADLRAAATHSVDVTRENAHKSTYRIPANSNGRATQDSASSVFRTWLLEQGAINLGDQAGDWFDAEGWFDVERFHQYLQEKTYSVAQLEQAGTRRAWGEQLRQMLFRADVRSALRLFDTSAQAQLVRCLSPIPTSGIHGRLVLDGPTFTVADGGQVQAAASLDINLAHGEVELFKLDLPERHKARDLTLSYRDHRQELQSMSLGRFSVHCAARAWGYAGASLLLSTKLEISPNNTRSALTLNPREAAQRISIEKGAQAKFNLFAGVQAGIVVTGALNWAPPGALARLRGPNPSGPSDSWLSLARLDLDLAAAAGLGLKGEAMVNLHQGRLVLVLKAALIAGPGAEGHFKFEVGYQAVAEIINLFRHELHKNQGKPLDWVSGDAATLMNRLSLLGAVGLNVPMLYLMGMDMVFSLYEALTRGGKGGPVAHAIIEYENQAELEQWFIEAPPAALGPMLMTLISTPKAFSVVSTMVNQAGAPVEEKIVYGNVEAYLLQQQAIERILGWIIRHAQQQGSLASAQQQFTDACMRMNRFGTLPATAGQTYCEQRLALDNFMSEAVLRLQDLENDQMRARYKAHAEQLGAYMDGFCQRSQYYGRTYIPNQHAQYTGPSQ